MSEKNTATPWEHLRSGSAMVIRTTGMRKKQVAIVPVFDGDAEVSALIVRACNTHDDLVKALQEAIGTIKAMSCKDLSCDPPEDVSEFEAVIAKATGETT